MQRSWVEIDEERLSANLGAVRQAVGPDTEVLAVVKANAYGHGAELCAPVLARAGARWFGVTDAAEGVRVRGALARAGFAGPSAATGTGMDSGAPEILVMSGSLAEEVPVLAAHGLVPVVWTAEQVSGMRGLAGHAVQIEIDTGMGRQGVRPGAELRELLEAIKGAGLVLSGVFTHLCSSEVAGSEETEAQKQRFAQAVRQVCGSGWRPRWMHIGNTSAIDNPAAISGWLSRLAREMGMQAMVRPGLALYGYTLPSGGAGAAEGAAGGLGPQLRPVLTWKTRILETRELERGDTVGYGATFAAPGRMRAGLLPVGYADGLRRELSNPNPLSGAAGGGWAMVDGDGRKHACPVIGRVSMNLTVIDISAAPRLRPGDPVTLLGDGVTADDHARVAGTIAYEILCGIRAPGFRRTPGEREAPCYPETTSASIS